MITTGVKSSAVASGEGCVAGNDVGEREIEIWLFSGLKKPEKQASSFRVSQNPSKLNISKLFTVTSVLLGSSSYQQLY